MASMKLLFVLGLAATCVDAGLKLCNVNSVAQCQEHNMCGDNAECVGASNSSECGYACKQTVDPDQLVISGARWYTPDPDIPNKPDESSWETVTFSKFRCGTATPGTFVNDIAQEGCSLATTANKWSAAVARAMTPNAKRGEGNAIGIEFKINSKKYFRFAFGGERQRPSAYGDTAENDFFPPLGSYSMIPCEVTVPGYSGNWRMGAADGRSPPGYGGRDNTGPWFKDHARNNDSYDSCNYDSNTLIRLEYRNTWPDYFARGVRVFKNTGHGEGWQHIDGFWYGDACGVGDGTKSFEINVYQKQ